jgi:hypothetical protein|tara:strand:+ start:556 stop:696 length:141 start_codon:yes stop_codon:yes gene_type:complete
MNNLIIFAVGFASVCVSAFVYSIPLGLFVFGVGLMLIGLLFDFERL